MESYLKLKIWFMVVMYGGLDLKKTYRQFCKESVFDYQHLLLIILMCLMKLLLVQNYLKFEISSNLFNSNWFTTFSVQPHLLILHVFLNFGGTATSRSLFYLNGKSYLLIPLYFFHFARYIKDTQKCFSMLLHFQMISGKVEILRISE